MVIAAAAIVKSAVAIPIETGPAAPPGGWRLALSCRDGGAKPAVAAGARRFALRALAILASRQLAALIGLHQGLRPLPQC